MSIKPNGQRLSPPPSPLQRAAVDADEEDYPEVKSVGIAQHPVTKVWAAMMITTRGSRVVHAETLPPQRSVELARLDAKELLLAALYREDL